MEMDRTTFRDWRQRLGLTPTDVSGTLGLDIHTLLSWERGHTGIPLPGLLKLACDHVEHCLLEDRPAGRRR